MIIIPEEGNGNPLQYSCLEHSMDGGAWWATIQGVAQSWTRLRDFTFMFHFHALEKEMATHSSVLAWRISGMGEPGELPSMGSHRVGHYLAVAATKISLTFFKELEQISLKFIWNHSSVQFSRSGVSNSLRHHESQHARPPCPSPTPGVYPNLCASSW